MACWNRELDKFRRFCRIFLYEPRAEERLLMPLKLPLNAQCRNLRNH
ncbi:Uncharacterised protein [Vibrio cholerae]|uniref:Uncharacterized protein n=1 Tax=Vibrio cholerae TaxID=666 RepID=A0A655XNK3_VIBCL|nr:Uncharacterised protein [Vibrio cholerae]